MYIPIFFAFHLKWKMKNGIRTPIFHFSPKIEKWEMDLPVFAAFM